MYTPIVHLLPTLLVMNAYYLYNGTKFAVQIMSDGYINDVFSCNLYHLLLHLQEHQVFLLVEHRLEHQVYQLVEHRLNTCVSPSRTPTRTPSVARHIDIQLICITVIIQTVLIV